MSKKLKQATMDMFKKTPSGSSSGVSKDSENCEEPPDPGPDLCLTSEQDQGTMAVEMPFTVHSTSPVMTLQDTDITNTCCSH